MRQDLGCYFDLLITLTIAASTSLLDSRLRLSCSLSLRGYSFGCRTILIGLVDVLWELLERPNDFSESKFVSEFARGVG